VKSLIFFPMLLLYVTTHGQENAASYSAFTIDNKEAIWVQVYHSQQPSEVLRERMLEFLKRQAWIEDAHLDGHEIVADLSNFRVDYKRYGGKYMNTSNIIRTGRWSGKTRITFKDGKYRVIVYGLEFDGRQPAMHAGKMSNQPHQIHGTWTDWVLNTYRTDFQKRRHMNMDIMHFNLKDGFNLKETELIDEDW
jgi:hypothetical protein